MTVEEYRQKARWTGEDVSEAVQESYEKIAASRQLLEETRRMVTEPLRS